MLDDIVDRARNAVSVMFSEPARIAGVLIGALIVMAVIGGSMYTSTYAATHFAKTVLPTNAYCTKPYYIFPLFTNGLNILLTETEIQCLGTSSPLIPTLVLWYVEFVALILLGVFIAVIVLDLQG